MPEDGALELAVLRCGNCGTLDPGPRELCPKCHRRALRPHAVPGRGRLVSWTVIRRPPAELAQDGAYAVAVVALDAGVTVTGRLKGADDQGRTGYRVACRERLRHIPVFERETP